MHSRKTNFLNDSPREEHTPKSPKKRLRLFLLLIICGTLFLSGCIGRTFFDNSLPNDPLAYDPLTLEPIKPQGLLTRIKRFVFSKDQPLAGEKKDRINILLLGMGGLGHDGPFLTDTMIVASIQPSTGDVAMISIPRDLGVDIPAKGWYKINHANAFGEAKQSGSGGVLATKVVNETFDADIHYYVRVDFKAVEQIIEGIDGLTIDVENSFTDTEYPAANYEYQTVSFQKGIQTMDGQTALQYARSRHGNNGEGSDFARAKRQQRMILALKEKILSFETLANPIRIHSIIDTLGTHISTNMDFSDIISMMKLAKSADLTNIKTVVLDTSPGGYLKNGHGQNGAFILEPVTGDFDDITYLIEHIFDPDIELKKITTLEVPEQTQPTLSPAVIEIQNGTWQAGLAARTEKQLENEGIVVTSIGNTGERPIMQSAIYILDPLAQDSAQAIKAMLSIPIKKTSGTITSTPGTELLIILGEDLE
jgi:polyisoprenyl-teichoic acid--peptidoglycan teichoic acid transferase